MTVPVPLSIDGELRRCGDCPGLAENRLTDDLSPCTCTCHPKERSRQS